MELIFPNEAYYESYREAAREYEEKGITNHLFLKDGARSICEQAEDSREGRNLPPGFVKATYLWLVDGGEFIGEASVRHSLTEVLLRFGGHIGYGVRCSRWNQGMGTALLSGALRYAKDELGLSRVLVTCDDDNIGSARVIEKNGGVLQDKIQNEIDGVKRITRRYWIDLK